MGQIQVQINNLCSFMSKLAHSQHFLNYHALKKDALISQLSIERNQAESKPLMWAIRKIYNTNIVRTLCCLVLGVVLIAIITLYAENRLAPLLN
jgi:hypothetical protein